MADGNNEQENSVPEERSNQELTSGILTSEQIDAFKQAFDDIDIGQSGSISKSELRAVLQLIGQNPTEAEVHQYLAETSAEGQFTKEELIKFVEEHVPLKTKEQIDAQLVDCFEKFDEARDMMINKDEFRRVLTKKGDEPLTETEADDIMDRLAPLEKDGKFSTVELGEFFLGDI